MPCLGIDPRLATNGRPPAVGRHLDSVILLNFFYFLKCFLKLAPTFGSIKCSNPHGDWRFHFFSNFIFSKFSNIPGIFVS
jgi:hypothetical protein